MELSLNFKHEAELKILEVPTRSQIGSSSKMYAIRFTGVRKIRSDVSIATLPVLMRKLHVRLSNSGARADKTYLAQLDGGSLRLTAKAAKATVVERVPVSEAKRKRN